MASRLRDILLKIEVLINQEDWDQALSLYEEIDKNWDTLISELSIKEAEELYKIISFTALILQEKYEELRDGEKYLRARKAYEKFS